jgi:hypothetical protein
LNEVKQVRVVYLCFINLLAHVLNLEVSGRADTHASRIVNEKSKLNIIIF